MLFRFRQHAAFTALMLMALLGLQSLMPHGVMAGDRANGENWLKLCGDAFALQLKQPSPQEQAPAADHSVQHCVFSQIAGMAFLASDSISLAAPPVVGRVALPDRQTVEDRLSLHLRPPPRAPPILLG